MVCIGATKQGREQVPLKTALTVLKRRLLLLFNVNFSCELIKKIVESTPDNSNLQGKLKKVRVIGSSSYRG